MPQFRPLAYMNKKGPFSAFFAKKAGSGDKLFKAKTRQTPLQRSPVAKLTTAGGTTVVPAVITLVGVFDGTETLNFTSVTDVQTTPIVEALSCPAGTAAEVATALVALLVQLERAYVANGDTIECRAVALSTTVTLSAVSLS